MKEALRSPLVVLMFILALSGCGSSDTQRILEAANKGLSDKPECVYVISIGGMTFSRDIWLLGILESHGIIEKKNTKFWGKVYELTPKGENLVVRTGSYGYCMRTGRYEAVNVKAVEDGKRFYDGQPTLNVRVTMRFLPEDWVASTKGNTSDEKWADFWKTINEKEQGEFIVSLVKSGDKLIFDGKEFIK